MCNAKFTRFFLRKKTANIKSNAFKNRAVGEKPLVSQ